MPAAATPHARKAPPQGEAFVISRNAKRWSAGVRAADDCASCRLIDLGRLGLKIMKIGYRALRARDCRENEPFVI
jgi:hypothetical protein